jgi:hypothetical protein
VHLGAKTLTPRPTRFTLILSIIFLAKILLATITVLGFDYMQYVVAAVSSYHDVSWSPWILLVRTIYQLWLTIPIAHGDVVTALTLKPNLLASGDYLLAALIKTPLIISDFLTGLVIYKLTKRLRGSDSLARKASLLWFANPFVTLLAEMWGSIDIILVFLTLASVALTLCGRRIAAALPLACAIALRLSPIVAWLGILVWAIRNPREYKGILCLGLAGPIGIAGYLIWLSQGSVSAILDMQLWTILGFVAHPPISLDYNPVTQAYYPYAALQTFGYVGLSLIAVLALYLLALETWPMGKWSLVSLISAGLLVTYGLAVWPATALLWILPYLTLWHVRNPGKKAYFTLFSISVAASLLLFNSREITSNGLSFLFVPREIIPSGIQLVSAIQSATTLLPMFQEIRSLIVGFTLAYATMIYLRGLVDTSL